MGKQANRDTKKSGQEEQTRKNSEGIGDPRATALPIDSDADKKMTDSKPEEEKKRPRTTIWAATDDTANGQVWTWNHHPGPTEKGRSIKLLPAHHPFQESELLEQEASWKLWITDGETPEEMASSVAKNLQAKWSLRSTKTAQKNGFIRLNITPVEVLGAPKQKLNCLPVTTITKVYVGVTQFLGCLASTTTLFRQGDTPFSTTTVGTLLTKKYPPSPYKEKDDVLNLVHDPIKRFCAKYALSETGDKEKWKKILTDQANAVHGDPEKPIYQAITRLSMTSPTLILGWSNHQLFANQVSSLWLIANELAGSNWPEMEGFDPVTAAAMGKVSFDEPNSRKPRVDATPSKIREQKQQAKKQQEPKSAFLLPKKTKTNRAKRSETFKYATFLEIVVPRFVEANDQWTEMTNGAIQDLLNVWTALLNVERLAILPFSEESNLKLLKSAQDFPKTKSKLAEKYVPELKVRWYSKGDCTPIRFKIAHNQEISKILSDRNLTDVLEREGIDIAIHPIQNEQVVMVGNLFGVNIGSQSVKNLETVLRDHWMVKQAAINDLQLLHDTCRTHPGPILKQEPKVKTIHVYTLPQFAQSVAQVFKRLYPRRPKPKTHYALAFQLRWYRETCNPDTIALETDTAINNNLRVKQLSHNKRFSRTPISCIKDIYREHPTMPNITCAKFFLGMKSTKYPDRHLLEAIEQEYSGEPAYFHFNNALHGQEMRQVIPSLALIAAGNFGMEVAKLWFTSDAFIPLQNYSFHWIDVDNQEEGAKIVRDDDSDDDPDADWEMDIEDGYNLQDTTQTSNEIIIANIDLASLDAHVTHPLDDEGKSTMTRAGPPDTKPEKTIPMEAETPDSRLSATTDTSTLTSTTPGNLLEQMERAFQ